MDRGEQLAWESRAGKLAAAAALATAALILAANVLRSTAVSGNLDNERGTLIAFNDAGGGLVASTIAQALSYLTMAAALYFLYRVTKHRRPETPGFTLPLVFLGAVLIAIGRVLVDLELLDIADTFTGSGERTNKRAENLLDDRSPLGVGVLQGGFLAFALSLVLLGMNAMRAGVLSRFMGILALIIAALYVIPIFGNSLIIQLFWVTALALLFLNRWPGGRGPAWETGEAMPWPTAADRARLAAGDEPAADGPALDDAAGEAGAGDEASATPRKRKRKRR